MPQQGQDIFLLQCVQTGSEAHPAFYAMGTWVDFRKDKAFGLWSWPLTSAHFHLVEVKNSGAKSSLPLMPSWYTA
jgi:hypothetical protein